MMACMEDASSPRPAMSRSGLAVVVLVALMAIAGSTAPTALDYLGSLDSVDREALALVAQADDAPPAILAMAGSDHPVPLILLAPPMSPGVETFRREQRWLAERERADGAELRALDGYIDEIAGIVLSESAPSVREYRLRSLQERSNTRLPRNAAFPGDERQAHFFASPLWHDRLAFDPKVAMALLASPVLVLIGDADANTPMDPYLAAARRALAAARTRDAAVCRVPGRTRHAFTDEVVSAIAEWLAGRVAASDETGAAGAAGLSGCLDAGNGLG